MASLPITISLNHSNVTSGPPQHPYSPKFTPTHLLKVQENDTNLQVMTNSYSRRISFLCKDGQLQEAVHVLCEMESQKFQIGPEIYGDLLQGCVYERNISLGQQIHAKLIKDGAKDGFIETKLVVLYAKCNLMEIANRLFCRLDEQNVFSWAAMIGLYCRIGHNENALLGFCEMLENGVEADNFVTPNVLKACGALLLIGLGKGVHGYVLKMGFEDCVFVASSLVDMYGKCGFVEDARKMFDGMPERNVISWNSMIVSYAQNGMYEEAMVLFDQMRREGIQPTLVTMVSFLSASANLCALDEGKQGHAIAILNGLSIDGIMATSLINLYSKSGLIKDAEEIYNGMSDKDVVTWNLMIACYVQHNQIEKALTLCQQMRLENLNFDSVIMTSIFAASASTQNLKLGKDVHCQCIRNKLVSDVAVASSMINMYAKCGKIDDARRVFDLVADKDVVLWNTQLAAYAKLGLSGETLKLFYQMQLEGVPQNIISWNSLIMGFLRNGQVNEAMEAFSDMQYLGIEDNLISHTILISGLVHNGQGDKAIVVFQEMQEKGIEPNTISIIGALSACRKSADLQFGRAIHGYVLRHGISITAPLANAIVDMYSKCGSLDEARNVFDMILTKELPLYNAMISGYASHGYAPHALVLFYHLQKEGLKPDSITFTAVLSACRHSGLVSEGLQIFIDMVSKYDLAPSIEHFGCVVSLLSQCGSLNEAFELVDRMPFKPDSHILGSMLVACREHNEIELAEYLAECLTKIEPQNSGNYVALSNAYAAAGRWDDVSELRSLMREKGVRKSPGCSWIQIGREVHVFVAGDKSKSQTKEIYTMLALLGIEMQVMGGNMEATCW